MARSGDRGDLLATGPRSGPLREPSALESSDDATWVAAARDGDRTAVGRLYERYARMVHGVLLAKVPVGDVDDIVQDVFLKALRRLPTLRESGSFGPWLAAIARNLRDKVWPLIEAGKVRPVIDRTFPLAEAAAAHRLMEASTHIGKILLRTS